MLVVDLDVKILGFSDENIELKETKRSISQLDLTVTSTTDGTVYDKVTLKVAGKDGLSVTTTVKSGNGCLKTANDGPPQRPHRLKHRGFGPDVGSWISELDLTQGTTQLPPYNDPNLEYRLKIQLNEKSATSPSPRAG
jgi:hypothetical protein